MAGSTIAASILIPLVLIVAVVGLVFAARRYHWLHRLQHLRQRHYDEVRIGQEDDDDDPPIAWVWGLAYVRGVEYKTGNQVVGVAHHEC